mgnify:CR=1 FL=1
MDIHGFRQPLGVGTCYLMASLNALYNSELQPDVIKFLKAFSKETGVDFDRIGFSYETNVALIKYLELKPEQGTTNGGDPFSALSSILSKMYGDPVKKKNCHVFRKDEHEDVSILWHGESLEHDKLYSCTIATTNNTHAEAMVIGSDDNISVINSNCDTVMSLNIKSEGKNEKLLENLKTYKQHVTKCAVTAGTNIEETHVAAKCEMKKAEDCDDTCHVNGINVVIKSSQSIQRKTRQETRYATVDVKSLIRAILLTIPNINNETGFCNFNAKMQNPEPGVRHDQINSANCNISKFYSRINLKRGSGGNKFKPTALKSCEFINVDDLMKRDDIHFKLNDYISHEHAKAIYGFLVSPSWLPQRCQVLSFDHCNNLQKNALAFYQAAYVLHHKTISDDFKENRRKEIIAQYLTTCAGCIGTVKHGGKKTGNNNESLPRIFKYLPKNGEAGDKIGDSQKNDEADDIGDKIGENINDALERKLEYIEDDTLNNRAEYFPATVVFSDMESDAEFYYEHNGLKSGLDGFYEDKVDLHHGYRNDQFFVSYDTYFKHIDIITELQTEAFNFLEATFDLQTAQAAEAAQPEPTPPTSDDIPDWEVMKNNNNIQYDEEEKDDEDAQDEDAQDTAQQPQKTSQGEGEERGQEGEEKRGQEGQEGGTTRQQFGGVVNQFKGVTERILFSSYGAAAQRGGIKCGFRNVIYCPTAAMHHLIRSERGRGEDSYNACINSLKKRMERWKDALHSKDAEFHIIHFCYPAYEYRLSKIKSLLTKISSNVNVTLIDVSNGAKDVEKLVGVFTGKDAMIFEGGETHWLNEQLKRANILRVFKQIHNNGRNLPVYIGNSAGAINGSSTTKLTAAKTYTGMFPSADEVRSKPCRGATYLPPEDCDFSSVGKNPGIIVYPHYNADGITHDFINYIHNYLKLYDTKAVHLFAEDMFYVQQGKKTWIFPSKMYAALERERKHYEALLNNMAKPKPDMDPFMRKRLGLKPKTQAERAQAQQAQQARQARQARQAQPAAAQAPAQPARQAPAAAQAQAQAAAPAADDLNAIFDAMRNIRRDRRARRGGMAEQRHGRVNRLAIAGMMVLTVFAATVPR